jgi:hypothetical protein
MSKNLSTKNTSPMQILFYVAVAALAIYWLLGRSTEPTIATFCISYDKQKPELNCLETITLRIPAKFLDLPGANANLNDVLHPMEVAYPSMQPWRDLSFIQQWNTQKIRFNITGMTNTTSDVLFETALHLGSKSPLPEGLSGLELYRNKEFNNLMDMRPLDRNRETILHCDSWGGVENDTRYSCVAWANLSVSTVKPEIKELKNWLAFKYDYKRILLPQWQEIDTNIRKLIQSFVVAP